MHKFISLIFCISLIHFNCPLRGQVVKSQYKIVDKIHLEGDAGWDYLTVDDSSQRLFVSHGTIVQVVNLANNSLAGTITGLNGVHGITVADDLNKGFISNGRDSSVTVFDLKTLKITGKIKVTGGNPDAIIYDKFSHDVFVFNGKSSNATVIEAATGKVVSTIQLDGKPEFPVSDGKGNIFVNIEDKSKLARINSGTLKVEKEWSIVPGNEPSGLAMDILNNRLFSVCGNKLIVITDATDGHVITSLPIGDRVDGVAFDPVLKRIYSSNGDGTMTVISEENKDVFKVMDNVVTQKGARTISLSKKTHHIYLPTADFAENPKTTGESPRQRPSIKPGTFVVLDLVRQQ